MLGADLNNDNRKTNGWIIREFNAFYSLFYAIFLPRRRKSSKKVVIALSNRSNQRWILVAKKVVNVGNKTQVGSINSKQHIRIRY